MQAANFNGLGANLNEIYAAISSPSNDQLAALYATSDSTVYYQGCLMGQAVKAYDQAWRWIQPTAPMHSVDKTLQSILTTLFDHAVHKIYDLRQRRIWNNMRQIDQNWNNLGPQDFDKQQKRYGQFLTKELKGSVEAHNPIFIADFNQRRQTLLTEDEEGSQRHTVVNFHQATYDFWSLFAKDEKKGKEKDREEIIRMREPLLPFLKGYSTLRDRPLFKALKKEGRWMQMEGTMHQSVPVALLAKLHDPNSLTIEESKRLKSWVQMLNRCEKEISLKLLSIVLMEVMDIIHLQGASPVTLPDILYWLDQQGCQQLYQEDPAHMDKREALRAGDTIECNGQKLRLGRQLSPQKEVDDTYKIFELVNYPDAVVKIGKNCFLLLIEAKRAECEKGHWGVRLVKTIDNLEKDPNKPPINGLDQQGRCVVIEKLLPAFAGAVWTSQDKKLSQEDEKLALVFANHVFCMSQWKATAQGLSMPHLMWSKKGVLKSTRLLRKGPANYNEWETYCVEAAKGNPFILSFLMNVSKLSKHDVARYYREAVEYTLKTGKTDLIQRALPLAHRQDIYNLHLKTLCEKAKQLREECFKHVVAQLRKGNQYSHKEEGQWREVVEAKLLEFYHASPTPGTFHPHLLQEVIAHFSDSSLKAVPLAASKDDEKYYKEKYELMMKHNQAIFGKALINPPN